MKRDEPKCRQSDGLGGFKVNNTRTTVYMLVYLSYNPSIHACPAKSLLIL